MGSLARGGQIYSVCYLFHSKLLDYMNQLYTYRVIFLKYSTIPVILGLMFGLGWLV